MRSRGLTLRAEVARWKQTGIACSMNGLACSGLVGQDRTSTLGADAGRRRLVFLVRVFVLALYRSHFVSKLICY